MAAAKARTGFKATYGFAQNMGGGMADFASRGAEYGSQVGQKTHGFAKSAGTHPDYHTQCADAVFSASK